MFFLCFLVFGYGFAIESPPFCWYTRESNFLYQINSIVACYDEPNTRNCYNGYSDAPAWPIYPDFLLSLIDKEFFMQKDALSWWKRPIVWNVYVDMAELIMLSFIVSMILALIGYMQKRFQQRIVVYRNNRI